MSRFRAVGGNLDPKRRDTEMKVAQVAPLVESVPPKLYGGTERVVSYLTEELVRQGHEVTLFASGDSQTAARVVPGCEIALRLNPAVRDPWPHQVVMLDEVRRLAGDFDILHFHIDFYHFPLFREMARRTVTTLHGRLDLPDLPTVYRAFPDIPLVSISNDQRRPLPPVNWAGTVYHGLPRDLLHFNAAGKRRYLAFLGRISPEKRPDRAIEIAHRAGLPLKIAAKVDAADRAYFAEEIKPLLDNPLVEFVGEICEADKADFLGGAIALLFPIDWPEPFGLVMVEAMACGTPVIAWRCGSVPEIVEHGVTGFIVDSIDAATAAVPLAMQLDSAAVRLRFEARFTAERMAKDYLRVYRALIDAPAEAGAESEILRLPVTPPAARSDPAEPAGAVA